MSRLSTVDKTMLSKLLDEKCFHYLTRKSPSSKFRPSVSSSDILSIYGAGYGVSHRDIKIGDILTFSPGDGRPMVFWNILQPFEQNALVDGLACPTWHVPYTGPWTVNREYVKSEISCDNIVVTEDKNSAIKVPVMRFSQPPVSSVASVLVTHGGMDCHSVALSSFTSVEFQQYIDTWAPKWLKFLSLEWDLVQEDEPLVFVTATCSAPDYGSILFDTRDPAVLLMCKAHYYCQTQRLSYQIRGRSWVALLDTNGATRTASLSRMRSIAVKTDPQWSI